MIKRNLHFILLALIAIDAGYSFVQHYNSVLDGDMARTIMPGKADSRVFEDPLGLNVLLEQQKYSGPNRFFAYWFMSSYFKFAPHVLQNFVTPVESIYLACAFAKTAIQVFIIYLLAVAVSGRSNMFRKEFLIAAILITPLLQTSGYNRYMGIIDPSVTYTFFYALPVSLLMLFFLPFFRAAFQNYEAPRAVKIFLLILMVPLSLSGPLIPGVVLVACPLAMIYCARYSWMERKSPRLFQNLFNSFTEIPRDVLYFFILFCLLCLYSLFIGTYNSENYGNSIPVSERYLRLPAGLYYWLTQKPGVPLLVIAVLTNAFIINKLKTQGSEKVLTMLKWIGLFSVIYIALLPLGGYRIYRPNIIRYDTLMPVVICLIFIYGYSTWFLLKHISAGTAYKIYVAGVILFALVFTAADKPTTGANACERKALEQIAQSQEKIVHLKTDCTVMAWEKITDYNNSEANAELLKYWGVVDEKKLYYQD